MPFFVIADILCCHAVITSSAFVTLPIMFIERCCRYVCYEYGQPIYDAAHAAISAYCRFVFAFAIFAAQ